jgi:CHAT domain-containing protein
LLALPSLGTARVIHVATHGEANESEPSRSGLWLAAPTDSAAPGFLSVGDIAGLKLSADLVTLSACETGVGRLERGEGVIGLTRAFLASGARGVVVSLWPVNDRSTARLMETFYESLLKKKRGAAESLADARRKLLGEAETRSPFYWAPFVLVGGAEGR